MMTIMLQIVANEWLKMNVNMLHFFAKSSMEGMDFLGGPT